MLDARNLEPAQGKSMSERETGTNWQSEAGTVSQLKFGIPACVMCEGNVALRGHFSDLGTDRVPNRPNPVLNALSIDNMARFTFCVCSRVPNLT
jgi:hypothetical protein